MKNSAFQKGWRHGIPICLGYLSVSFTYGMYAVEGGIPFWAAILVSMTSLTSAGQFAGTDLIIAGASYMEIAVTTFVINLRYMLMSLSLSQKLDHSMTTSRRALLSFGITDEIYAMASQEKTVGAAYFAGLVLPSYLGWVIGTTVGATATGLLPMAVRSALGIAIYGMFLAIIIPPATKVRAVAITVIIAAVLRCVFLLTPGLKLISGGWAMIICAITAAAIVGARCPIEEKSEDTK